MGAVSETAGYRQVTRRARKPGEAQALGTGKETGSEPAGSAYSFLAVGVVYSPSKNAAKATQETVCSNAMRLGLGCTGSLGSAIPYDSAALSD